jgi:hypothetical protein
MPFVAHGIRNIALAVGIVGIEKKASLGMARFTRIPV